MGCRTQLKNAHGGRRRSARTLEFQFRRTANATVARRESERRHIVGVLDASTSPPKERYAVSKDNIIKLIQPGNVEDQLTEILRNGARCLLAQAVEAEVADFLGKHADLKTEDGHQRVVRHGHLPEREVLTGLGPVAALGSLRRGAATGLMAGSLPALVGGRPTWDACVMIGDSANITSITEIS